MNLIFVNKYLLFREQDRRNAVLLLFFCSLPLTALLPHAHTLCAIWVVLFLLFCGKDKHDFIALWEEKTARCYTLFLVLCLSGCILPLARSATLLSVTLRLSFLLPLLFSDKRREICRILAYTGGVFGGLTLLELFTGRGTADYNDLSLFPSLWRASGLLGNPNVTAAFLLPAALFALSGMLFSKEKKWSYAVSFLGSALGVLATFSRGAILALALSSFLLFARRFGLLRTSLTLVSFLPLSLFFLPSSLLARLSSVLSPDSSVLYRFSLWKSIARLPASSLVFGVGEGREALLAALSPVLASGLLHVEHTHSLFLHVLLSSGIVGLCLFLFLCARALLFGKSVGARAALLSLLLFGIFDDPLYSGQTEVLFWLVLGLC